MRSPRNMFTIAAMLAALLAAACGEDTVETTPSAPPESAVAADEAGDAFPIGLANGGRQVRIEKRPTRIVSLSPTSTEMLFAVDAGDQVVAVDDQSNFPAGVPTTKLSGFTPNVEAIAAFEPDLVVASDDREDVVNKLTQLAIPVLLTPAAVTLDDTYTQIEQVGLATGHLADAAALVARMRSEIDALVAGLPKRDEAATYFHELGPDDLFTVSSKTFIGQIYALAGLTNIADSADDGSGYPKLTKEALISADPDFIFLADTKCCQQTGASVGARPGFDVLSAVRNGRVVGLDDDIASRWGPRVVDLLRVVTGSVAKFQAPQPAAVPVG